MKNLFITAVITSSLLSGAALAKDDCTDPVKDWQPKEQLQQLMVDKGWDVKRIKVDDGCYEVKGLDRSGHEVEAKFSPASFNILELEIKFTGSGDASDYLDLKPQTTP
ncbi:PepSY domain-containing protein [Alkalimarinus alittae]|uniref:PepSY domain-containing protein n=1 Tax=Alkalimarinus alittae TaxID=2961619 RepID=A0ABY6N234_9ALTE|nr:PepSY domain-containing protein [Alkalimarinus alittae]UZE96149.1 PepSY domain-containing protein [Alkalimarinus alittae]